MSTSPNADGPADERYLMVTPAFPGMSDNDWGIYLWKSPDGIAWTSVKTIAILAGDGVQVYANDLIKLPNGRFAAYTQNYNGSPLTARHIGAHVSDSADITGSWSDRGLVITSPDLNHQGYSFGVHKQGAIYFGFLALYNSISQEAAQIDLYISRDGLAWTLTRAAWLEIGATGAWDSMQLLTGKSLARIGNAWRYYYVGFSVPHDDPPPKDGRIGYAEIGFERIGGVTGTGTVEMKNITPASGEKLYVNCDASGGSLKVEVLDAGTGLPRAGYAASDFDTITNDTFSIEATWDGLSMPTGSAVRLKFTLADADLYAYHLADGA